MLSLFLTRFSSAIEAYKTGPYTFNIYDQVDSGNKSMIKQVYTKIAHVDIDAASQDKVKDISDLKDELDYKITTINDENKQYTIVRQTLTNIGKEGKRYDLCTVLVFAGAPDISFYSQVPNFGAYFYLGDFDSYVWVQQNHPSVTNGKLRGIGGDENVRFFTHSSSRDAFPLYWISESWTNNYLEPGQSVTISFMIHKNDYEPPLLNLEKDFIKDDYEPTEKIHIKGSFSYYYLNTYISANYNLVNKVSGMSVSNGVLKDFTTYFDKMADSFDIEIGPFAIGAYALIVYTRQGTNTLEQHIDITISPPNAKPKVTIFWPEYKYDIPETEITIQGYVSDPDARDKTIATAIYFNGKVIYSANVTNTDEIKTFKFTIPKDTPVGEYDIRFTANDGKLTTERKQTIIIRDNTVLSIDVEPKFEETYKKGDKLNFTAVVNDPDTDFESKFVIFVYYKDTLKPSLEKDNKDGMVRVPLQFSIPSDETEKVVTLKVKVTSTTEKAEK